MFKIYNFIITAKVIRYFFCLADFGCGEAGIRWYYMEKGGKE